MFSNTRKLSSGNFGASTFFASAHPSESCGSNGLPLTPNSIKILGYAQSLYQIDHPHLCTYVDIVRGKHERIIVVQEHYKLNLSQTLEKYEILRSEKNLKRITREILLALAYLNDFGTVCHNLSPQNILVDPKGVVKLYGYGLYYITEAGNTVDFPIGWPKYLPPERLLHDFQSGETSSGPHSCQGNPSWDSWSVGLILLECLLNVVLFEKDEVYFIVKNILSMALSDCSFLTSILEYHGLLSSFQKLDPNFKDLIQKCLEVDIESRPVPSELLSHPLLEDYCLNLSEIQVRPHHFPVIDSSSFLVEKSQFIEKLGLHEESYKDVLKDYPHQNRENGVIKGKQTWRFSDIDHLSEKSLRMVYYLWRLAGGNLEQELKKLKIITSRHSILTLPSIVSKEGEMFGGDFMGREMLPTSSVVLPLETLRIKLSHIPVRKFYPLITHGENAADELETRKLPLVIREKDVEYQFHRLNLFERLLKAYPYKVDAIIREAKKDVPPFFRAFIWASLLRVDGAVQERYERIDKETPTSTDRQIEVDIPRCHQYDELLSSPTGHAKFTRILKSWVVSHPHLVYWQGLDSLCAPFLYLNFENEGLAFACLSAFISKYLHGFFLRDNSAIIQEYLAKFSHLIAFHDPALFGHLHSTGFIPELYAIPWFLTMFTHVFPLHKIFLLWDTLLLGNSSLPLFVGVALLRQLKDRLLQFGFNECILLFSDMPDINMEQVVNDAVDLFCSTPSSFTFRKYDNEIARPKTVQGQISSDIDNQLSIDEVSLEELKSELCGRISGADVLELLARRTKSKVVVIDIRPSEEFNKGSLPSALSIPYDSLVSAGEELHPLGSELVAASSKGKIIVVMGSSEAQQSVVKAADALLLNGFPRVCTLHKGIEVFRTSGQLVVPSS